MTWERVESTSACGSCRAYWSVLQDLGEEWDAAGRPADPDGWGHQIGQALAMYCEHLKDHMPKEQP